MADYEFVRSRMATGDFSAPEEAKKEEEVINPKDILKQWNQTWKAKPAKEDNTPLVQHKPVDSVYSPGDSAKHSGAISGGSKRRHNRKNSTGSMGSRGSRGSARGSSRGSKGSRRGAPSSSSKSKSSSGSGGSKRMAGLKRISMSSRGSNRSRGSRRGGSSSRKK